MPDLHAVEAPVDDLKVAYGRHEMDGVGHGIGAPVWNTGRAVAQPIGIHDIEVTGIRPAQDRLVERSDLKGGHALKVADEPLTDRTGRCGAALSQAELSIVLRGLGFAERSQIIVPQPVEIGVEFIGKRDGLHGGDDAALRQGLQPAIPRRLAPMMRLEVTR